MEQIELGLFSISDIYSSRFTYLSGVREFTHRNAKFLRIFRFLLAFFRRFFPFRGRNFIFLFFFCRIFVFCIVKSVKSHSISSYICFLDALVRIRVRIVDMKIRLAMRSTLFLECNEKKNVQKLQINQLNEWPCVGVGQSACDRAREKCNTQAIFASKRP